jgi:hypothetical protein
LINGRILIVIFWRSIEEVITSRTRNAVVHFWARGFESHLLRQSEPVMGV